MDLLVVGLGFGQQWLTNVNFTDHWDVAGIVARTRATLEKVGKGFGIPPEQRFQSIPAALDALPNVDAVVVATPNNTHLDLALEVLRQEKHLILEKPIVTNVAEARTLFAEIARHPDLKVMVGHTMRGEGRFRAVRDLVASGTIGTVEMVTMRAHMRWLGDPTERWRFGLDDIMLDDIGIHQFDMLRMLLGERECQSIYAQVFNPSWYPLPTRTSCSALLELEDQIKVNYFCSMAVTGGSTHWIGDYEIIGSEGTIFTTRDKAYYVLEGDPKRQVPVEIRDPEEVQGLAYLLEDFHAAITADRPPLTNIQNNLHSFLIVEAAKRSAEKNAPVHIPSEMHAAWMPGVDNVTNN